MLCLSGFELYSRWVPLNKTSSRFLSANLVSSGEAPFLIYLF